MTEKRDEVEVRFQSDSIPVTITFTYLRDMSPSTCIKAVVT